MPGARKIRSFAPEEVDLPANLWQVLERGRKDTFPIHTALWLFKNAQGGRGAYAYLPGPEFGYRTRDGKSHSTDPNNAALTLQAVAWFLCVPAMGSGHLAAGPTAGIYGGLTDGFIHSPILLPTTPSEVPAEVRELLAEATFPLTDLPTLTPRQIELFLLLRYIKYTTIFGPLESQLLRKAQEGRGKKVVPPEVERDVKRAMDRAVQAFEMPALEDWAYDRERHREFIGEVRCNHRDTIRLAVLPDSEADRLASSGRTSPYSPPFLGLPIFDLRPFFQEALRLVKQVPEKLEWHPSLCFLNHEDWERLHRIVRAKKFSPSPVEEGRFPYPSKADQQSAWEWIESMYGLRGRAALYPSDRSHH